MAKKIKVVLNKAEVRNRLLKSKAMADYIGDLADRISGRCGSGYETSTHYGVNRVNVSVVAGTNEAVKDNLKNNTILRNLRA